MNKETTIKKLQEEITVINNRTQAIQKKLAKMLEQEVQQ